MDDSRIKAAREVLSAFFDEEKLRQGGRYVEFFASWKFLVGEQLAAHSHIADIKNRILYIEAEHPGWIQLLQLRQSAILAGIATRFPEFGLRGIAFRLGAARPELRAGEGGPGGKGPASPKRPLPPAEAASSPAEEEAAAEAQKGRPRRSLEEIQDPALKALLSSLKRSLEGEEGKD